MMRSAVKSVSTIVAPQRDARDTIVSSTARIRSSVVDLTLDAARISLRRYCGFRPPAIPAAITRAGGAAKTVSASARISGAPTPLNATRTEAGPICASYVRGPDGLRRNRCLPRQGANSAGRAKTTAIVIEKLICEQATKKCNHEDTKSWKDQKIEFASSTSSPAFG